MLKHTGTLTIKTERLVLRKYRLDDLDDMFENWASDKLTTKYLVWEPYENKEKLQEYLGRTVAEYDGQTYSWVIEFEGAAIGAINLHSISDTNAHAELGYCLGSRFWNRGLMTEATHAVIDFAFRVLGAERVFAMCDEENLASDRVMQKNGMKYEGKLRRHSLRKDGTYGDICIFGILREEYQPADGASSQS